MNEHNNEIADLLILNKDKELYVNFLMILRIEDLEILRQIKYGTNDEIAEMPLVI